MDPPLYQFKWCREDAERIIHGLRLYAKGLQAHIELSNDNPDYQAVCWDEYGIVTAIADDIEFVLP